MSEDELWVEADSVVDVDACTVDAADLETDRGDSAGACSVVVECSPSRSSLADVAALPATGVVVPPAAVVVTLPVAAVLATVLATDAWAAASESNAARATLAAISERLTRVSLRSDASRRLALGLGGMQRVWSRSIRGV